MFQVVGVPVCPALIDTRSKCQVQHDRTCVKTFQGGELVGECQTTRCDEDGSFLTQYCSQDSCWCVDRESGERVLNTEFQQGTHYCNEVSERVYLPPCLRQNTLICTDEGLYASMQCDEVKCFCVYSDSGEGVSGQFDVMNTVECAERNDTRGPCQKERDRTCEGDEDCSVLTCDEEGDYLALQCQRGDVCICVDQSSGQLTSPASQVVSDVICSPDGELIEYPECFNQDELECDGSGNFAPSQCYNDGTCFCLYGEEDGECLEDSRTHCERRREYQCDDDEDCPIQCDSDGKYGQFNCGDNLSEGPCVAGGFFKPHHCTGDICYCVDINTGNAIAETLSQGNDFYCSPDGQITDRTLCQEQSFYSCDDSGYFLPVQEVDGRFECLYIDTGAPNYHDSVCAPSYDLRTQCQKVSDDRCPYIYQGVSYVPDTGCATVQCDPDTGLFLAKQCHKGVCYCVEVDSGVLGGRPDRPETEFYCLDSGELVVLTLCRKQGVLECTTDGQFAPEQFVKDIYFCVFSDSGEVIEDTKSIKDDIECSILTDQRTPCQKARDDICPTELTEMNVYSRPEDCTALTCDASTGRYSTKQCSDDDSCFCVDPASGSVTSDSAPGHTFACDEEGVMTILTLCQQQDLLICTEEGDFQSKQCFSDTGPCYCVYSDSGVLVHNSDVTVYRCDVVEDERTDCQLVLDEECPARLRSGHLVRAADCSALSCTEDGEYPTMHCVGNACYCVDIKTGTLIEDTRGPRDTFVCSREGERLRLTPCRRQSLYSCDSRGNFHATQCDPSGECVCVFVDSGYIREVVEWCDAQVDNRTDCQKERDAGCGNLSDCFLPDCDFHGELSYY